MLLTSLAYHGQRREIADETLLSVTSYNSITVIRTPSHPTKAHPWPLNHKMEMSFNQFVSTLRTRNPLKHTSVSFLRVIINISDPFSQKFRNTFPKGLITRPTSIHALSPNFAQIGHEAMAFRRNCIPDKKCVFSGPFWPRLTEGAQSFRGSVVSKPPSLCKISSISVHDSRSYSQKRIS